MPRAASCRIRGMWIALSLICALSLATADALTKRALSEGNEYLVGWLRLVFTMPFLAMLLPFVEFPRLDSAFYLAVGVALPFETLAFILYIRALKVSPMSLTIPFLAFTPVFLIASGYFIAGEAVSPAGITGIILIAGGSYALNFSNIGRGFFEPFRAVFRERGPLIMLAVAAIYSVTSSLGKVAINHSSALFFGAVYYIVFPLLYSPFALPRIKWSEVSRKDVRALLLVGLLNALMIATHMLAMSMTKVAYMISVKRTSLLFSVIYGYLLFREGRMRQRGLGAALMFAGFVLVVIAS
jgi:drug/metabolite transporter (DMT)-like permease